MQRAQHDGAAAAQHFRKVLDTNYFSLGVHGWAEAFLQRMEDDPNWLPWLRKLKEPGEASKNTDQGDRN